MLRVSSCRRHACVKLLCELGLYEDAVNLALAVDLELAKAVANSPEDDDSLRRKLWLSIAKYVVQGGDGGAAAEGPEQAGRIKMAVELLKEAGKWHLLHSVLQWQSSSWPCWSSCWCWFKFSPEWIDYLKWLPVDMVAALVRVTLQCMMTWG